MFVGPFFYFNRKHRGHTGLLADLMPVENAELYSDKLGNPQSHQKLFEQTASDEDYINVPRGRVVFDTKANQAIIYIDRCLEAKIFEIAMTFQLDKHIIEHDEHYICPDCADFETLWD